MARNLPEAITAFMNSLDSDNADNTDAALRGFALGAVVVNDDESYRGTAAIRGLLETNAANNSNGVSWKVDYAMDTEFVVTMADDRQLQFLLDCGRIAYLRIAPVTAAELSAA
jgi:hypothetical protein